MSLPALITLTGETPFSKWGTLPVPNLLSVFGSFISTAEPQLQVHFPLSHFSPSSHRLYYSSRKENNKRDLLSFSLSVTTCRVLLTFHYSYYGEGGAGINPFSTFPLFQIFLNFCFNARATVFIVYYIGLCYLPCVATLLVVLEYF